MCAPLDAAPGPTSAPPDASHHGGASEHATGRTGPLRVGDGLWCIPVPVPHGIAASTLVYAIETDRGPVLIDAGSDDDIAWNALTSGLNECGIDVTSTYGVLLTHAHSDHHGLTRRIRHCSGAWVAMHPLDARMLASTGYLGPDWPGYLARLLAYCGAPVQDQAAVTSIRRAQLVPPDRLIEDGDQLDVPGWGVTSVWTPGHTPGHLCYRLADRGLLFSGDHVLPTISSRVGVAEYGGAPDAPDALGELLVSLERVAELEASEAWPGHGFAMTDYRERCRALMTRHHDHLQHLIEVLGRGPTTVWAAAERLAERRPWDTLEPSRRRLIVLEVLARLAHLRAIGTVSVQVSDGVAVFALTQSPAAGTERHSRPADSAGPLPQPGDRRSRWNQA
jgi:glyoxylase-like metal-dependent hydrolase (beta-lactamase superfamily II)